MSRNQLDYINSLATLPIESRTSNAFETYVRERLIDRARGGHDLGALSLREVIFASECLGALSTWGPQAPKDWQFHASIREIRSAGFAILSRGEPEVASLLETLVSGEKSRMLEEWRLTNGKQKMPPLVLSRLLGNVYPAIGRFSKMEANNSGAGKSWFVEALARCATNLRVLEPGTSLFGHPPVDTPYMTLVQAAKGVGITTTGLRSALIELNIISPSDDCWANEAIWVNVEDHRSVFEQLVNSHSLTEAAEYVGSDTTLISQLFKAGKLRPLVGQSAAKGMQSLRFLSEELDRLIEIVIPGTTDVSDSGDKTQSLIAKAATKLGCSRQEVVRRLLAACFKSSTVEVPKGIPASGTSGDSNYAAADVPMVNAGVHVGLRAAARMMVVDPYLLPSVLGLMSAPLTTMTNPINGRDQEGIELSVLEVFVQKYVSLGALADHLEMSNSDVRKILAQAGVHTAIDVYARFYNRSDFIGTEFERLNSVGLDALRQLVSATSNKNVRFSN